MTRLLGVSAVALAFAFAIAGMLAAVIGARRKSAVLVRGAESVAQANFALLSVANLAMIYALVTHDFSISYVAQVGSRATPLLITVISLWSALEGSILFWGWILAAVTAIAVHRHRAELGTLGTYAMATLFGVSAFFFLLLLGPANPFHQVFPVPADGPGPNPLLQNHILMAVHPPFLYLGYVGFTVPFAFAIGALISGRLDDAWIRATRRWTVAAWMFLSLAIIAGMWWSYEVLGWGGYWAWDPVENASFMPWLTATAFLHSVMVQERRGMLRVWNLSLIITTFLLTILGTFLTRSGIISSVHAFTQGSIGYFFLIFIGLVLVFSLVILAGRAGELGSAGALDRIAARPTVFLINNLLLTAFCFTVLLGTLFPLIAEAARGVKVSVGAPFFNRMTVPLVVALLFLIGVGPILPWAGSAAADLRRKLALPAAAGVMAATLSFVFGARDLYTILAFTFAAFALIANLQEFAEGTSARMRANAEPITHAFVRLVRANPRRYGGYLAHIGLIIAAAGVAGSSTFKIEREATLKPGQSMAIGQYVLRFDQLWAKEEPHRFAIGADLVVLKAGKPIGQLEPRLNYYSSRDEPVPTPHVLSGARNDLYTNLLAFEQSGASATLHVLVEPLVSWIWVGGVIVALGALVGVVLPQRKVRRAPRAQSTGEVTEAKAVAA